MEGQALMRGPDGTLYAAGSHLTGWAANAAQFFTSPNSSLVGAQWINNYNPSSSGTTYDSQSTFIFPFKHQDGHTTYMWMADRWCESCPGGLDNMTNIWLPMIPPSASNGSTPSPAAGWLLQINTCNSTDQKQQFMVDSTTNTVKHVESGLCVSQPADMSGLAQLQLQACSGAAAQTWLVGPNGHTLVNMSNTASSQCVDFNVANNDLQESNPVIAYSCGNPPVWNEQWQVPTAGTSGSIVAFGSNSQPSTFCLSVTPATDPTKWQLPWYDSWSLKDF
jgi:hypothetical protein